MLEAPYEAFWKEYCLHWALEKTTLFLLEIIKT